jgi:hypothetical protein
VAAELEGSAGRAQARGGLAAAAAFLERAAALTPDPAQRSERALAAAQAKIQAGAFDAAVKLLGMAEAAPLDEFQRARADLLRAQLAFAASQGSDAPPLLLKAAKRLESIDAGLARATYLDAMMAALFACRLASPDGDMLEVARAASAAPPPPHAASAPDLLLDGLAANFSEGPSAGAPILRRALSAFDGEPSGEVEFRGLSLAFTAAMHLWDANRSEMLSNRYVRLTRRRHAAAFAVQQDQRQRLGARGRSALTSAAERGRVCRSPIPRGDRAAWPHPDPRGTGPRASGLRRMAAARKSPGARPGSAPGTTRADRRDSDCMNETCDRCGPAVRAVYRAERTGELYLCRHCGNRLWPALYTRGWTIRPVSEHALARLAT